jgi:phosphatidylglycerophosphate synthase
MKLIQKIPNILSFSRILLSISIFFTVNNNFILLIATWNGISDFLDGFLARKLKTITIFSTKLDQISDKIVILLFLIYLYNRNEIPINFVFLVIFRDILIFILRKFLIVTEESNWIGKFKTLFIYLLFIYIFLPLKIQFLYINVKNILLYLIIFNSYISLVIGNYKLKAKLIYLISTSFYSSLIFKKAAGTISSAILTIIMFIFFADTDISIKISILITLVLFHYYAYEYFILINDRKDCDPNIYTLDEFIALILAWIILGKISIIHTLLIFILFRFFDIFKLAGISKIEKTLFLDMSSKNLFDDLVAIIYSIVIFKIII